MKKLISLLLLTFLSLPYLAWGMEVDAEEVDKNLSVYKIGPSQSNSKIPAKSYEDIRYYKDLGYRDPNKDIKFEFWYMDNEERSLYVKFNPQNTQWIELKSGDRLFSPKPIDTLCYSLYKDTTDGAKEYQCFGFSKRNKVFVQLIDRKFSGQVGTAPGGETAAKALAFIGSKTPFRGKIRTTLSGLSLEGNIKNNILKTIAFTEKLPPDQDAIYEKTVKNRTLEGNDIVILEPLGLDDASQNKITKQEANNKANNLETLNNILADIGDESTEKLPPDQDAIYQDAIYEKTVKTFVDFYKNRTLESNDIVILEPLGLDDASQHKITRQEANNSETLKNILEDMGDGSIIPVIGINPTVIDHAIAILVDPSKTSALLGAYWKNDKFDEFIHFINAINYLNIKDAIKVLKDEYFLTAEIPPADEINDTKKSIILDITQVIKTQVIKDRNKDNIKRREDGDFISQQIQPLVNNALQDISFDEDPINLTIQGLKNVWGEDSRTFNSILRFLVYNQENLIMDHLKDFDENIQDIITKHRRQKDAEIKIDEELSVLDYWALNPDKKPDKETTMINIGLSHNTTEIEKNAFDNFQNLQYLNLGHTKLTTLPDGIFDKLTKLNKLALHSNQLKTLPDNIFDKLTKLKILNLYGNQLETLPDNIFDKLTNLQNLDLSYDQLTTLPKNIFDKLTELRDLSLHNNQLKTLPKNIFDQLGQLESLNLHGNQLETLPDNIFDKLTKLTKLGLHNNQLKTLPDNIFDKLTELRILDLYNNQLKTLPNNIFDQLGQLESLNLHGNQLETLPDNIFDQLGQLIFLFLSGNKLKTLPNNIFDQLKDLQELSLSDDQLTKEEIDKLRKEYAGRFKIRF